MEVTLNINKIYANTKQILLKPKEFVKKQKTSESWKVAFGHIAVVSLVGWLLFLGFYLIFPSQFQAVGENFNIVFFVLYSYLIGLLTSFLWAGGLLLLCKLFKIDFDFSKAYTILVYSKTPAYLFGGLPYISLAALIYSVILFVWMFEKKAKVSRIKAVAVLVVGILIIFASLALLGVYVYNTLN